jgi:multisubunit Na+/H+ antiporter MnhF subunit
MSAWMLATFALLPPLGLSIALCARGPAVHRAVALQLAGSLAILLLVAMSFAFAQASSIDLALTLSLLGVAATLLFALSLERWL